MLIPLFFVLLLVVLINRAGKKFQTSSTIPLVVSIPVFVVFVFVTRGAIRVPEDKMIVGILLGLLMYSAVVAILFAVVVMWMRIKSPLPLDTSEKMLNGVLRFKTLVGVREKPIDWKYPLSLFLGFACMVVFYLLRTSIFEIPKEIFQYGGLIAIMVIGFYFLIKQNYLIIAVVVALVYGGSYLFINSIFGSPDYLAFLIEFVFAFVFIVATILLLNRIKNPWIALGVGCYLAETFAILVILIRVFIDTPYLLTIKQFFLNVGLFTRGLDCAVFSLAVFGFFKLFKLNLEFLKFKEKTPQRLKDQPKAPEKREIVNKKLVDLVEELAIIYRSNPQGFGIGESGKDTKWVLSNGKWNESDGTSEVTRIREIGKIFNHHDGMECMRWAHKEFSLKCLDIRGAARNLEFIWDGIGNWRG